MQVGRLFDPSRGRGAQGRAHPRLAPRVTWAGLLWDFTGTMMVFLITAGLTVPVGLYFVVRVREDIAGEKP